MLENLKKFNIILASNSPRRKQLLSDLGVDYVVRTLPDVDESYPDSLVGEEIPAYISQTKAEAYRKTMHPDELIITADTIVWLDGIVYGKPKDEADAKKMLRALSGKTHDVITGVCVTTTERQETFAAISKVTFASFSDDEINYYIEKYRPMDKAGSYGVQEWIGYIGVERIDGSFYNVMGLPVQRLYTLLKNW